MRYAVSLVLLLLVGATSGCAPRLRSPAFADTPELNAFAREIERSLEAHDWPSLLAAADPDHYRIQAVEGGMGEPQYVAELFGLHRVDNNIKRGDTVTWSDLERIESVTLQQVQPTGDRYRLRGHVRLTDGATLELLAQILEQRGRYRLTGGVG